MIPIITRTTEELLKLVPGTLREGALALGATRARAAFSVMVPAGPAGKEGIDIRFTYDLSGLLEVEVLVETTGQTARLIIEGNPGILSQAEIDARMAALKVLKIHPRDQAENQAVIARAERLYEERLGDERAAIAKLIDDFRVLLERQIRSEINDYRIQFSKWLDRVDTTFFS